MTPKDNKDVSPPLALVIGLCSHGVTISRSLHSKGVEVHAFESNPQNPGIKTNSATVHHVASMKDEGLITDLLAFRKSIPAHRKIVLYATNDKSVELIAANIAELSTHFEICWSDCAAVVKSLLLKSNIEKRCSDTGLRYPRSFIANDIASGATITKTIEAPFIVKPVSPQSGFKALKVYGEGAFRSRMARYTRDFPVIIQQWISGTADDIYFCAIYFAKGIPLVSFTGRKYESYPPALGQTTVAVTFEDETLVSLTKDFFSDLGISGPVSLEFKRDNWGNYWVIEPTVGRTDFWLGLCTAAGVDFPTIQYEHSSHGKCTAFVSQAVPAIWFDSGRDPSAPLRFIYEWARPPKSRLKPHFSFFAVNDPKPYIESLRQNAAKLPGLISRKFQPAKEEIREATATRESVSVFTSIDELPPAFTSLLHRKAEDYIFFGIDWFNNFAHTVANKQGTVEILCLSDSDGSALAVLPLWRYEETFLGVKIRKVCSLENYYTPRFDILCDEDRCDWSQAARTFFNYLRNNGAQWDVIELHRMWKESIQDLHNNGRYSFPYYITRNFRQNIDSDFSCYLQARPSRLRNTIKRKERKLERNETATLEIVSDQKQLPSAIQDYEYVYASSWKRSEPFPKFIDGLMDLAIAKKWLLVGQLKIDNVAIASQIWLVANGAAYIYKLSYNPKYSEYSPGTLLTAAMFEHVIDKEKVTHIDFLLGNDQFKKDWMNRSSGIYGILFPNPKTLVGLALVIKNSISTFQKNWIDQTSWWK